MAPEGLSQVVCQSLCAVLLAVSLTTPTPVALTYALEPAPKTARGVVSAASEYDAARAMSKYLLAVLVGVPLHAKLFHSSSRTRHAVAAVVASVVLIAYVKLALPLTRLCLQVVDALTVPVGPTTLKR